jgi:RNA polymerase sigma-70 factor (ECF subfamily)
LSFHTTHWSLIVAARSDDSARARAALGALCEIYWYPLYAYVRRRGENADAARDLTQAFLTSLIERHDFDRLSPERGRFRAFLLAALKHFLSNDAARQHARKRGAGSVPIPLAFNAAEGRYNVEPSDTDTPESLFERRWALTVIDRVLATLRQESEAAGRGHEFDALKSCLLGEAPRGGYAVIARRLDTTEGAVKVAVHRLRRRFQTELRRQIAETVADETDVDDEIRYLIRALRA